MQSDFVTTTIITATVTPFDTRSLDIHVHTVNLTRYTSNGIRLPTPTVNLEQKYEWLLVIILLKDNARSKNGHHIR